MKKQDRDYKKALSEILIYTEDCWGGTQYRDLSCVSSFLQCCDEIPDPKHLKKERICFWITV